jgi:hypothetical protein
MVTGDIARLLYGAWNGSWSIPQLHNHFKLSRLFPLCKIPLLTPTISHGYVCLILTASLTPVPGGGTLAWKTLQGSGALVP